MRNWRHAIRQLEGNPDAQVSRSFVNNRVIRTDETIAGSRIANEIFRIRST